MKRYCPYCAAELKDLPKPTETRKVEYILVKIGRTSYAPLKLDEDAEVGTINCPHCGKPIDIFV
jgi:hypothetical protein